MSIRWYDYLSGNKGSGGGESLLSGPVDISNELFIGKQYLNAEGKKKYRYAVFSSTHDFWEFMLKTPESLRTFNEVSPALRAQKLRFDIDMDKIYDPQLAFRVIGYIVAATILVLIRYNVILDPVKDILIFNSNSKVEGKEKTSYHIIIDNYSYANFHVVVYLASLIFEYIPNSLLKWIDKGVYTRDHMLRIYRNVKVNESFRIKRLTPRWIYRGNLIETFIPHPISTELDSEYDFYLLEHSLVTWTFYCQKVPILVPLPPPKEITVTDKGIEYAISLYDKFDKDGMYHVDEDKIEANYIPLVRNFAGFCKVCKREHDSIDAYLVISDKAVYFKCWRSKKGSINLGNFDGKGYIETNNDDKSDESGDDEREEINVKEGKLVSGHGLILNRLSELAGDNILKEIMKP